MGTGDAALNRCHARSSLDCWSASPTAARHVMTTARPASMARASVKQAPGLLGSSRWATLTSTTKAGIG
eukprot:8707564-Pyramimonas_sp.AAC.1